MPTYSRRPTLSRRTVDHYTVHELADCGAEGKAYSDLAFRLRLIARWYHKSRLTRDCFFLPLVR